MVCHLFSFCLAWLTLPPTCSFAQCISCTGCMYADLIVPGQAAGFCPVCSCSESTSLPLVSRQERVLPVQTSSWNCGQFPCRSMQPVCSTSLITAATFSFSAFSLHQLWLPLASPLSSLGNRTRTLSPPLRSPRPLPMKPAMLSGQHSPGLEGCHRLAAAICAAFTELNSHRLRIPSAGKGSAGQRHHLQKDGIHPGRGRDQHNGPGHPPCRGHPWLWAED